MPSRLLTIEEMLPMLAAAPERIVSSTAALAPVQLHSRANPAEWSANEVLTHLRACADMWGGCIERIIAEEMPALKAVNPRTWIKQTDYLELAFRPSLRAFTSQRVELLALLEPLPLEAWSRAATVTVAGKPFERTVHFYANWLATHERPHLKQIERIADTMRH